MGTYNSQVDKQVEVSNNDVTWKKMLVRINRINIQIGPFRFNHLAQLLDIPNQMKMLITKC